MRKVILFGLLALLPVAAMASSRVTVDQLQRMIASSHGKRDAKIAARLSGLELTERLSMEKLTALEAVLPGPLSRRTLVTVADKAVFLDPPQPEIAAEPAPTLDQQRAMLARTGGYIESTIHRLPNLYALRDTIHFEDQPPGLKRGSRTGRFLPAQALHPVSRTRVTVLYREGRDWTQASDGGPLSAASDLPGLSTRGEFGAIFAALFGDMARGKLAWDHWERDRGRQAAVFRFSVPKPESHYQVKYCCVREGQLFQQYPAYHGKIAIDAGNGTILRVTLLADFAPSDPVAQANLMVEYGPVLLGQEVYSCPVRSVSYSLAPAPPGEYLGSPLQAMLNEVVFDHYHLFHSDAHILTGEQAEAAAGMKPPPGAAQPAQAAPEPRAGGVDAIPVPAAAGSALPEAAAAATSSAPGAASANSVPAAVAPEIALVPSADLSDMPAASDAAGFSLHVHARLVDISVMALDKKGKPVTDLTRDDFEVFDDGVRQDLSSFGRAGAPTGAGTATSAAPARPSSFSNRPDDTVSALSSGGTSGAGATVVFLDGSGLSLIELIRAREQVVQFLNRIDASEPVGLYVRAGYGFRVLAETTADHGAAASALRGWKPGTPVPGAAPAQDGQSWQMNVPPSESAGMGAGAPAGGALTVSMPASFPNDGSGVAVQPGQGDPLREALVVLAAVAVHMGALPGHKNLVWVAGNRLLATPRSGRDSPGSLAMHLQETLNNAHVSLYPLAVAETEAFSMDASLGRNGIEAAPSAAEVHPASPGDTEERPSLELPHDIRPIQRSIQQIAQATGGRSMPGSSDLAAQLMSVAEDGRAAYVLSIAPLTAPDDRFHRIRVAVPGRRGVKLRYRTGYLYSDEPATLKGRLQKAIWEPVDESGIALTARRTAPSQGAAVSLRISASDIGFTQRNGRWTSRLELFLVQREDSGMRAAVKEQTLSLALKPSTYEQVLRDGIPFEQYIGPTAQTTLVRLIVADPASGHLGTITLPAGPAAAAF